MARRSAAECPLVPMVGGRELMDVVREDRMHIPSNPTCGALVRRVGIPISCRCSTWQFWTCLSDVTHYQYLHDLGYLFPPNQLAGGDRCEPALRRRSSEMVRLAQMIFHGSEQSAIDYRSSQHQQPELAREGHAGALPRTSVFLNPMGTKLYLSLAHDRGVCDEFCERLKRVLSSSTVRS